MKRLTDYDQKYEAKEQARERRYDAEHEIRALSAVAEHLVRQQNITGAEAMLRAIDLVRSARTVA
jgi:hypothetical protein